MNLFAVLLSCGTIAANISSLLPKTEPILQQLEQKQETLAPHPVMAPLGKPGVVPVRVRDKEFRYVWDGEQAYLLEGAGNGDHKKGIAIKIGKKKYWIWADGKPVWFDVHEGSEQWDALMKINPPGEGPPTTGPPGNGGHSGNGDPDKHKKRLFVWALASYSLVSLWLGFAFYIFHEYTWVAALTLGLGMFCWLTAKMWFQKDINFFMRIIASYFSFGVLTAMAYLAEKDGIILGTLALGLLTLMTVRLLTTRKHREYYSGMYEIPRPKDEPKKHDKLSKVLAGVLWFAVTVGLYLRQYMDLSLVLFLSVALPYFLNGVYLKLLESYSNISVRVTQLPRLGNREPEYNFQRWFKRLQISLKVMLATNIVAWGAIFITRLDNPNLFIDPLIFLLTFMGSFGLWRCWHQFFGRLK